MSGRALAIAVGLVLLVDATLAFAAYGFLVAVGVLS
jgi:hypothetical protein